MTVGFLAKMPTTPVHVLLTGSTGRRQHRHSYAYYISDLQSGYIGGSVLTKLLTHSQLDTFQITVLVRDPAKAEVFKSLARIKPVVGSYSDLAVLRELASEADIVIACASLVLPCLIGWIFKLRPGRYKQSSSHKGYPSRIRGPISYDRHRTILTTHGLSVCLS